MAVSGVSMTGALLEGRYRVEGLLGCGGMSRVYRGTDTRLDRRVAIKVMDARLAGDPVSRRRFEREARAAARLDDQGVVGVYDQGEDVVASQRVVYLVMELVEGGTLRDVLLDRGALEPGAALAVLEAMLAALACAHQRGMAHRDIKPDNVLISDTGVVKVADFGLVSALGHARMTAAGVVLGTADYLAPEQLTAAAADARCDVYACGVVLFEMLTGTRPFVGTDSTQIAHARLTVDVPAPSTRMSGLPAELDALVLAATARDPKRRLADAATSLTEARAARARLGIAAVGVPTPNLTRRTTVPLPRDTPPAASTSVTSEARPGEAPGAGWPPDTATHRATRLLSASCGLVPRGAVVRAAWLGSVLRDHVHPSRRTAAVAVALLGVGLFMLVWWVAAGRFTTVPAVVGLDRPNAERLLTRSDLVAVITPRHDNTAAAGVVTVAVPAADAQVPRGTVVDLVVSTGRPRVPEIAPGTSLLQAQQLLRAADLVPSAASIGIFDAVTAVGTVVTTTPPVGTPLPIGAPVTLVVSRGQAAPKTDDPLSSLLGSDLAGLLPH